MNMTDEQKERIRQQARESTESNVQADEASCLEELITSVQSVGETLKHSGRQFVASLQDTEITHKTTCTVAAVAVGMLSCASVQPTEASPSVNNPQRSVLADDDTAVRQGDNNGTIILDQTDPDDAMASRVCEGVVDAANIPADVVVKCTEKLPLNPSDNGGALLAGKFLPESNMIELYGIGKRMPLGVLRTALHEKRHHTQYSTDLMDNDAINSRLSKGEYNPTDRHEKDAYTHARETLGETARTAPGFERLRKAFWADYDGPLERENPLDLDETAGPGESFHEESTDRTYTTMPSPDQTDRSSITIGH